MSTNKQNTKTLFLKLLNVYSEEITYERTISYAFGDYLGYKHSFDQSLLIESIKQISSIDNGTDKDIVYLLKYLEKELKEDF